MSSSAFCSICSKGGREVQVLCEGRCLICSKCEQSPAIKKLMMECVEKGADTTEATARCPICELPVSRSMLQTFLDGNIASKSNENDMFEQEHPFNAFLKKFRQSYKDVVGNDSNDLLSTLANDRPSTPNDLVPTNQNGKQALPRQGKLNAKQDPFPWVVIPPFTPAAIVEWAIDMWCCVVSSVQKYVYDSAINTTMKLYRSKKFSQRSGDFKIKALIDFLRSESNLDNPDFLLLSRLLGLHPRSDVYRPAVSTFSALITVFARFDKSLRRGSVLDETGAPSPTTTELRSSMTRSGLARAMPLSKALRIVEQLHESKQPHWAMSTLSAGCVEYSVALPWAPNALCRLLHLLFHVATPVRPWSRGEPTKGVMLGRCSPTNGCGASEGKESPNIFSPIAGQRGQQQHKSPFSPAPMAGSTPGTPGRSGGAGGSGGGGAGAPSLVQTATLAPGDMGAQMVKLFGLQGKLAELTAASVKKPSEGRKSSVAMRNGGKRFDSTLSLLTTDDLGCVNDGKISFLSFKSAATFADNYQITASELCLVCIVAWEQELATLQHTLNRAIVVHSRRPAIAGTFQASSATVTKELKLAMSRIVKWHKSRTYDDDFGFAGNASGAGGNPPHVGNIDWDEIKEIGRAKGFPFRFPEGIFTKTSAELNHIVAIIEEERERTSIKEAIEDLVNLEAPYGVVSRKVMDMNPRTKYGFVDNDDNRLIAAGVSMGYNLSADEQEKIKRQMYLSTQSLGQVPSSSDFLPPPTSGGVTPTRLSRPPSGGFIPITPVRDSRVGSRDEPDAYDQHHMLFTPISTDHGSRPHSGLQARSLPNTPLDHHHQHEHHHSHHSKHHHNHRTFSHTSTYESPVPSTHRVTMTDIIEVKLPSVLSKVKLLDHPLGGGDPELDSVDRLFALPSDTPIALPRSLSTPMLGTNRAMTTTSSSMLSLTTEGTTRPSGGSGGLLAALGDNLSTSDAQREILSPELSAKFRIRSRLETRSKSKSPPRDKSPSAAFGWGTGKSIPGALGPDGDESAAPIQEFSFRNKSYSLEALQTMAQRFMTKQMMFFVRRFDLSYTKLDEESWRFLCGRMRLSCRIVHLSLSGLEWTDSAFRPMLEAMILGGAPQSLVRLDLNNNRISLATQALIIVNKFVRLRVLDLSFNNITTDVQSQRDILSEILTPLAQIETLSLAHNRFQDHGLDFILQIGNRLPNLQVLDLTNCFLTTQSRTPLKDFLTSSSNDLRVLMLQRNLLRAPDLGDLRYAAKARNVQCLCGEEHYAGIALPLGYEAEEEESHIMELERRRLEAVAAKKKKFTHTKRRALQMVRGISSLSLAKVGTGGH